MRRYALILASCLLLLAAAACVTLERKPVDKHLYALETRRPGQEALAAVPAPPPAFKASILVRRLQAAPRAAGRELVYRMAPSSWTADYYNLFFVSPADMLTQDLRAWLTVSGLCANVLDPASLAPSDYILEGNVSSLHGDFAASPPQAVVEMQFMLLKELPGGERRVVLTRQYSRTSPLAERSPQALVDALKVSVSGVYAGLEGDLRAALAAEAAPAKR